MTSQSFAVRIIFATLLCGCSLLQQSAVLHNLYLIICKLDPNSELSPNKMFRDILPLLKNRVDLHSRVVT
jgi:hypothetical protein